MWSKVTDRQRALAGQLAQACALLRAHDDILILGHRSPDGDAYGSAFGLLWALEDLGKRARVETSDGYDPLYRFMFGDYAPAAFEPKLVVTVDVADPDLLGTLRPAWESRVGLCVDHHRVNTVSAPHKLLDPDAPAASLLVYRIVKALGVPLTRRIADSLFTGLTTDTGCFRYESVTAEAHRAAAALIEAGARAALINKVMFDSKTKARLAIDRIAIETMEFHFGDRCALIAITAQDVAAANATEAELDGISSMPRAINGVKMGITLREKREGGWRVSLRSRDGLDAAAICQRLGGGGHKNAGGCTLEGTLQEVKARILAEVEAALI